MSDAEEIFKNYLDNSKSFETWGSTVINYLLNKDDESDRLTNFLDKQENLRGKNFKGRYKSEKNHSISYVMSMFLCGDEEKGFYTRLQAEEIMCKEEISGKENPSSCITKNRNIQIPGTVTCCGLLLWLYEALELEEDTGSMSWGELQSGIISNKDRTTKDKLRKKINEKLLHITN